MAQFSTRQPLPPPEVLQHVTDAHCHPTDGGDFDPNDLQMRICAMATRTDDQVLVANLASRAPDKVIPCFGYHPWFYHKIALLPSAKEEHYRSLFTPTESQEEAFQTLLPGLPEPRLLSDIITELRSNLVRFPNALLGEVGLDRAFRHSFSPYPSPPPRKLTPFVTPMNHQLKVLEAQLALAVELRRNISLHSVQAQQITVELLERMAKQHGQKWTDISICLHSCGLSPESWTEVERKHPNVFLSLSVAINARSPNHIALIQRCSPSRILVESDMTDDFAEQTWQMVSIVANIKGWQIETSWDSEATKPGAVRILERNWEAFARGGHTSTPSRPSRKVRKLNGPAKEWHSDESGDDEPL